MAVAVNVIDVPSNCGDVRLASSVESLATRGARALCNWIFLNVVELAGSKTPTADARNALKTSSTVAAGFACLSKAQAPVTWGAAMDVPAKAAKVPAEPGFVQFAPRLMLFSTEEQTDESG